MRSSRRRRLWHCDRARSVPRRAVRRIVSSSVYANPASSNRYWFVHHFELEVRSANRGDPPLVNSLGSIFFRVRPRAQGLLRRRGPGREADGGEPRSRRPRRLAHRTQAATSPSRTAKPAVPHTGPTREPTRSTVRGPGRGRWRRGRGARCVRNRPRHGALGGRRSRSPSRRPELRRRWKPPGPHRFLVHEVGLAVAAAAEVEAEHGVGGWTSPTDRGRRGPGTAARCPRTAPRWCPREGSCRSAAGATGGSACPRPPAVERRRSCPRSGSLPPERADGLDADGEFPPHRARVRTRSGHRPHRGFPPCIARPWPDCALRIGYPGVREASFALTCKRRPMAPRAASIRSSRERRCTSSTRSTCGRRQPRRRASSALPTP